MTLPASIGSASHFDQGTDDPKQARAQLKQVRDDIESINDHLKLSPLISPSTPLGIGNGLESSGGNLAAKLDGSTLGLSASGLKVDDDAIDLAQLAHGTAGDLLYYGASGVPTRLAKGSDGQVLGLTSGLPAWTSAGSIEVIDSDTTFTDVANFEVDVTGYDEVELWFEDINNQGSSTNQLVMQLKTSTWLAGTEYQAYKWGSNTSSGRYHNKASFQLADFGGVTRTDGNGLRGSIKMVGLQGQGNRPMVTMHMGTRLNDSGSIYYSYTFNGYVAAGAAITAFRVKTVNDANDISGELRLATGRKYS